MSFCISPQTAASTVSWRACSVSSWLCVTSCWTVPPVALVPVMTPVSAAAVLQRSAATVTCLVTWTVELSTPAVSLQTVWRSVWSVAAFVSPPETWPLQLPGAKLRCSPVWTTWSSVESEPVFGTEAYPALSLLLGHCYTAGVGLPGFAHQACAPSLNKLLL